MISVFDIISSSAKIKILRTLFYQNIEISLRQLAVLSDLQVNSVQHGIKQLLKENVITEKRKKNLRLFRINKTSSYYTLFIILFTKEMEERIRSNSSTYNNKARSILNFSNSSIKLLKKAKKDKNGSN
ncbi:MAG: helix-turn-helix transcriptional regulator [Pseudomonadota bacterium]